MPTAVIRPLLFTVSMAGLPLDHTAKEPGKLVVICGKVPVNTASCVPFWLMVELGTAMDSAEAVVLAITTLEPAALLNASYTGETAPFHIRNS